MCQVSCVKKNWLHARINTKQQKSTNQRNKKGIRNRATEHFVALVQPTATVQGPAQCYSPGCLVLPLVRQILFDARRRQKDEPSLKQVANWAGPITDQVRCCFLVSCGYIFCFSSMVFCIQFFTVYAGFQLICPGFFFYFFFADKDVNIFPKVYVHIFTRV